MDRGRCGGRQLESLWRSFAAGAGHHAGPTSGSASARKDQARHVASLQCEDARRPAFRGLLPDRYGDGRRARLNGQARNGQARRPDGCSDGRPDGLNRYSTISVGGPALRVHASRGSGTPDRKPARAYARRSDGAVHATHAAAQRTRWGPVEPPRPRASQPRAISFVIGPARGSGLSRGQACQCASRDEFLRSGFFSPCGRGGHGGVREKLSELDTSLSRRVMA